jgi:general secretion pathway protein A
MYKNFYGLKENPFSLTTDPRFFYYNEEYRQFLKYISFGIKNREGFVEIMGDVGSGKTIFCHALINQLGVNTKTIFLPNAYFSELEFLEVIAYKLGIDCSGNTQNETIQAIADRLIEEYNAGKNVVLIFDEAQNLTPSLLEQIRQLSNIATENNKPLQIILVGQPELENKLRHSALKNVDQRISLRYRIKPLKKKEIEKYIFHRLKVAGYTEGISFTKGALNKIYYFSKGVPRLINILCDKSLLVGYFFKTRVINSKVVNAAIKNTQSRWYHFPYLLIYNLSKFAVVSTVAVALLFAVITLKYQHKIITWTKKISPSMSLIKTVVLRRPITPSAAKDKPAETQQAQDLLSKDIYQLIHSTELKNNPSIVCTAILIKMWGIDQPVNGGWETWKKPDVGFLEITNIARKYGLEATQLKTDLAELQAIDLPCILSQVYDPQLPGLTPMVLAKLSQDKAILYHPNQGVVHYTRQDLIQRWSGQAIVMWPNLDRLSEKPLFSQGTKQDELYRVGIRLRQLGYIRGEKTIDDEQTLKDAIRKFQQDNQLRQDGILGTPSKMALYRILNSPFSPSLKGEG